MISTIAFLKKFLSFKVAQTVWTGACGQNYQIT